MADPEHDAPESAEEMLAAVGITVTPEGVERARQRLAEADARWTPERWAALREHIGRPQRAA